MSGLTYQRLVIGYHGCDEDVVAKALLQGAAVKSSENDYDWLGRGIYFWEHGPRRAYEWAKAEARRAPGKVKTPAVLGAYINLGQCFDLLDTANTKLLQEMHPEFQRITEALKKPMPENEAAPGARSLDRVIRKLDCAMINWSLDELAKVGLTYQTVRGVFIEGGPSYPGAGIMLKSHIQIAVRDQRCIVGFFRPNPGSYLPSGSTP